MSLMVTSSSFREAWTQVARPTNGESPEHQSTTLALLHHLYRTNYQHCRLFNGSLDELSHPNENFSLHTLWFAFVNMQMTDATHKWRSFYNTSGPHDG